MDRISYFVLLSGSPESCGPMFASSPLFVCPGEKRREPLTLDYRVWGECDNTTVSFKLSTSMTFIFPDVRMLVLFTCLPRGL